MPQGIMREENAWICLRDFAISLKFNKLYPHKAVLFGSENPLLLSSCVYHSD